MYVCVGILFPSDLNNLQLFIMGTIFESNPRSVVKLRAFGKLEEQWFIIWKRFFYSSSSFMHVSAVPTPNVNDVWLT